MRRFLFPIFCNLPFAEDRNIGMCLNYIEHIPIFGHGAANATRTHDLILTKDVLYLLSYSSLQKSPVSYCQQSFGRGRRIRTLGTRFWRPLLYQLSYTPLSFAECLIIIHKTTRFVNTFFKLFSKKLLFHSTGFSFTCHKKSSIIIRLRYFLLFYL